MPSVGGTRQSMEFTALTYLQWVLPSYSNAAQHRDLIADRFPMIIVDEFQDTDNDQWRIVNALSRVTDVLLPCRP